MKAIHLRPTSTPDEILVCLRENGYAIIDRLASEEMMDKIAAEVEPYIEQTPYAAEDFLGRSTRRTGSLVLRSPTTRDLIMHPTVLATAGRLLEKATTYQLHLTQVISVYPGSPASSSYIRTRLHGTCFRFPMIMKYNATRCGRCPDYTEEMGATRVVPKSQYSGRLQKYQEADSVAAEMERGSVLFYTGKVYHGAGANRSKRLRQAINLTYSVGWVRQEENQFLSCPHDVARALPTALLHLMGYQCGCLGMGVFRDYEDPINALFEPEVRSVADATIMRPDKQNAFFASTGP